MYVAIRRPRVTSTTEAIRRINEGLLAAIEKLPGFVAFQLLEVSEEEFVTLTYFDTKEHAEESNRLVLEWIPKKFYDLIGSGPNPVVGELKISRIAKPQEFPGEKAA